MISPARTSSRLNIRIDAPVWTFGSLAGLIALVIPISARISDPSSRALAIATIAVCWFGLVLSINGGARICQIIFWSFYGSWLGIAPLYQLSVRRVAWSDDAVLQNTDRLVFTQLLILSAAVCFLIGSMISRAWPKRVPVAKKAISVRLVSPLVALGVLGVLMLPLAASYSGGLANLFSSRAAKGEAQAGQGVSVAEGGGPLLGLVGTLPAGLSIVVAYFAFMLWRQECQNRRFEDHKVLVYVALSLGLALLALYSNPLSNTRFIAAAAVGCSLLALFQPKRALAGAWLATISITIMLFAYPLAYAFRGNASVSELSFNISDWAGLDFDGFQQWINTVQYVDEHGISKGIHVLGALLYAVPRSTWASKPEPASITIATDRGYLFTNLSLPFPAELYLDFGVPGLIILMFAMGWLWNYLDESWLTGPSTYSSLLAPVVATQQVGLIRGPLGSLAPVFFTVLVLAALAIRLLRVLPDRLQTELETEQTIGSVGERERIRNGMI